MELCRSTDKFPWMCDECGRQQDKVINFDLPTGVRFVCRDCLQAALDLLDKEGE